METIITQLKKVNHNSIIGDAIKLSIEKNHSPEKIIGWLKAQATDGYEVMADVLGKPLTDLILTA